MNGNQVSSSQSDVINIKVGGSRLSKSKGKGANEAIEIWKGRGSSQDNLDKSQTDASDIADEFEYNYDENLYNTVRVLPGAGRIMVSPPIAKQRSE